MTVTLHKLNTSQDVVEFLTETFGDEYVTDYCSTFGEPGYSDPSGDIPLLVFGNFWCRCNGDLHIGLDYHYPEVAERLAEAGVEFHWYDEWTVVYDEDAAYRTEPDSYSWKPSVILGDDCEWLTPKTPTHYWIEWALNDSTRCIPEHIPAVEELEEQGFAVKWDGYASGWYGREDSPSEITEKIHQYHPGADIVFVLESTGQFEISFSAYVRPTQEELDEMDV